MSNMAQSSRAAEQQSSISLNKKDYNYLSKNNFGRIIRLIVDKEYRFNVADKLGLTKFMSDEKYLKHVFKMRMGYDLNLDNPKTFNEKLNWLKLHDRNPEYTRMVDKYEVKKYVAEKIGAKYVIPLLGVYNNFDEINFDEMPEQFILKCTHDSGGFVICRDKKNFDVEAARAMLTKHLKINYYLGKREWVYKNIKPRIIAEKYIDTLGKPESIEYKLTCFNGVAKLITICKGIAHTDFDKRTNDHYDRDLNPLKWYAYYKNSPVPVQPPKEIHEIIALSEKLAAGIPQVRVDSYLIDGKVYFGEMTFYTHAGMIEFNPPEWDEILGSWIELPKLK